MEPEIAEPCLIKVSGEEGCELRPTSLPLDSLPRGSLLLRAGFPFQMLNKRTLYLYENMVLGM